MQNVSMEVRKRPKYEHGVKKKAGAVQAGRLVSVHACMQLHADLFASFSTMILDPEPHSHIPPHIAFPQSMCHEK